MLSHDRVAGLNRWWVWRKGLARFDFFENQLGMGLSSLDFAHHAKAAPMQWSQSEVVDRAAMIGRRIAAIMLPPISRIAAGILHHHPVAGDLGDDRGGGDRAAFGVAVDDRLRRALPPGASVAVDQHPGRLQAQ